MSRRLLSKLTHADQAGLALLLLCGVLSTLSPVFLTVGNITNILRDASIVAIAGFGMVVIILQGGDRPEHRLCAGRCRDPYGAEVRQESPA